MLSSCFAMQSWKGGGLPAMIPDNKQQLNIAFPKLPFVALAIVSEECPPEAEYSISCRADFLALRRNSQYSVWGYRSYLAQNTETVLFVL